MANTSEQKHNCMECLLRKRVEMLRLSNQLKFNQEKSTGRKPHQLFPDSPTKIYR